MELRESNSPTAAQGGGSAVGFREVVDGDSKGAG